MVARQAARSASVSGPVPANPDGNFGMNVVTSVVPLRPKAWGLSGRQGAQARRRAGLLGSLLWLPVAFTAAEAVLDGDLPRLAGLDGWLHAAGLAVGGVPLAWACGRLRRMGYGGGSYLTFGTLAPATVAGGFSWAHSACCGSGPGPEH